MSVGVICCKVLEKEMRSLIDMKLGEEDDSMKRAEDVAAELKLRLDTTEGSLSLLTEAFNRALDAQA